MRTESQLLQIASMLLGIVLASISVGCAGAKSLARKEKLPAGSIAAETALEAPGDVESVLRQPARGEGVAQGTGGKPPGPVTRDPHLQLASGEENASESSLLAVPSAPPAEVVPAGRSSSMQRTRELARRIQQLHPDQLATFMEEVRKGAAHGTLSDVLDAWDLAVDFGGVRKSSPLGEPLSTTFVGDTQPVGGMTEVVGASGIARSPIPELPQRQGGAPIVDSGGVASLASRPLDSLDAPPVPVRESGPRRIPYRSAPEEPEDEESVVRAAESNEPELLQWAGELDRHASRGNSNPVRYEVASRLLRAVSGDSAGALEPVPSADIADRRFWQHYAHAGAKYLDESSYPRPGQRATEAAMTLRESIAALADKADLEITDPIFCRSVQSFGNYDEFPKDEFRAGDGVVVYWEVRNFASVDSPEGYRTRMQAEFEILDSLGSRRRQFEQKFKDDVCRNRRTDYFNVVVFEWPKELPPGDYVLKVTVTDQTSQKTCERQKRLRIVP